MKKLLVILTLAIATPAVALPQVLVGRSAPRVRRPAPPPVPHNLTVDEEYDLSDSQAQIVQLDTMIADLSAQGQAGTLTAEGRTEWQSLYEQRVVLQARIDALVAKRDAG
jgi:hypothetical protein